MDEDSTSYQPLFSTIIPTIINGTYDMELDINQMNFTEFGIPLTIELEYCGTGLKTFGNSYRGIHGYTSLVVCLIGSIANILNLIVLTRREMINPTNAILTGLALADLLNMLEYVPYAIYLAFFPHEKTYGWALFVLMHSNFSQVCHTISIWLNVTLAIWRYIMVALPMKSKTVCTMPRAKYAVAFGYLIVPIICIPNYLTYAVRELAAVSSTVEEKIYIVNLSDEANNHPFLMTTNFWLYSVVMKLLPCAILTIVSLRLIHSIMKTKKRQNKLYANRRRGTGDITSTGSGSRRKSSTSSNELISGSDRTTKMLLVILLLFLFTECPQGLLVLFSGPLGYAFFRSCYMPLADLMDFFALLNSSINFILYCAMSSKFRETFSKLFLLKKFMTKFNKERGGNKTSRPVQI